MVEHITINRAPVLTLWGVVVAERLGYDRAEALSLGKCLAGLNAQSKGRSLGMYGPPKEAKRERVRKAGLGKVSWVEVCGRSLPVLKTQAGLRAVTQDKPIGPEGVQRYLEQKFGGQLPAVRQAMTKLARSLQPADLKEHAYSLYLKFRPEIPKGRAGWGAKGELNLELIRSLSH